MEIARINDIDHDSQESLQAIAEQIASSIDNSQMFLAAANRLAELSILVEISEAISTSLDRKSLFERLAGKLLATTAIKEFAISSWDRDRDQVCTLMTCIKDEVFTYGGSLDVFPLVDFPSTRDVLEKREMRIFRLDDPDSDPAEVRLLAEFGRENVMILPMVVRNQSIGIIEIYPDAEYHDWEQSSQFFQSIANQIAAALENIQLFEEAKRDSAKLEEKVADRTAELEKLYAEQAALAESERNQRQLVETLQEAGAIVASNLDPGRAINEILNQLARVVPHDSASVQLLHEDELVIVGGGGWPESEQMQGYRFLIPGPNPNTIVLQERRPVILNKDELAAYPEFKKRGHSTIYSWLGVPLITQATVIGMLTLDSKKDGHFTEQHASLARAFADQVAVAIEQAILFQKTQAALIERDALRAIVAEITDELDLSKLLNDVMVRACKLLDAVSAEIGLYNEQTRLVEIVAAHNMGGEYIGNQIPLGTGLLGKVAETREPIIIPDYTEWEFRLPNYQQIAWRAVMAAPLTHQQRLIGVIAMADTRPERTFFDSDVELLVMLAHQVAIAIENAQLFQEVQRLATTDELTGLPNRRELTRIGDRLFEESKANETPMSAVMFDIDLFKRINDSYGHGTGDQVLKGLGRICKELIRDSDLLCRYGGEEFTLILPNTDFDTAFKVAERLRQAIETTPIHIDRGELQITVSFGIAALSPRQASLAALVDEADAAMYLAKNMGRNRVEGYYKSET